MKRLYHYMNKLSEEAFTLLAGTLKSCCAAVFCAFMLLVHIGPVTPRCFDEYRLALELALSPVGVLLVGSLCAVVAEDLFGR